MLPPITKKYSDLSTDSDFSFSFFCDRCGETWTSQRYPFSLSHSAPGNSAEVRAHEIMWQSEHDAAYERANIEAILHFNKCPRCGDLVCDSCFRIFDDLCEGCYSEKPNNEN